MKNLYLLIIFSIIYEKILAQSFSDPNFSVIPVISGWTEPVGTAFSKDGEKVFVWEKAGMLYVCNRNGSNYTKQTTPVINLTAEVLNWRDHGLMGFALDPDYLTNGYIYLLYVVDRRVLMNDNSIPADAGHDATIARLTRYRVINSGGNLIADAASRTILIGESPSTGIPVVHEAHVVGCLAFAADGTLLVSTGDAASYYVMDAGSDSDTYWDQAIQDGILRPAENVGAFRSQILNCHNGKLLRIDPNTGNGVHSNPFFSPSQPRLPKSRVWAMGFRNAFRILVKPGTGSTNPNTGDIGEVYVADVGWSTWEEFSIITGPGMNGGWPIYEGHEINSQYNTRAATLLNMDEPNPLAGQSGCTRPYFTFRELIKNPTADENKTINNPCNSSVAIGTGNRYVHRRPTIDFKHEQSSARVGIFNGNNAAVAEIGTPQSGVVGTPFAGNCALAGVWYTGNNFPPDFKNTFLLLDNTARWIKRFTIDYTDVITRVDNFVSLIGNIVTAAENPLDGTLFFVDITANSLKKIVYGGNQPPVAVPKANVSYGVSPLTVNFTGNTSFDLSPGGSIASYSWNFGGGTPATSTTANPTGIVFTNTAGVPKKFVVKLTVTDNGGATDVDSVIISVNNTPPIVNITSPVKNSTYPLGGDAVYNCTATVTDNEHSGSQLTYEWQTILRHNSHEHPEPIDNNVSTTTRISRIGCNGDTYYWMVRLKVTDAAGLSTTDSSKIFPDCGSDNIPPVVTSTLPANGATAVSITPTVSADFNEALNASTVTNTTFQLKDPGNNIISATINTSSNQITLTPTSALTGSTIYTATTKGGASGVKDLAGNPLAGDYSWSFTTVAVDNIPPTVTSVLPSSGATGISTGTTVSANFSEALNASTVTGTTFQLRDAGNNLIGATINTSGNQITLTPSAALAGLTAYTATITGGALGVKDLAGNALASNYSWSFTTTNVDNTPPTVSTVTPSSGATGISVSTNVTATFNEAINASTVTTSSFQLRNSANTLITATVSTSGNQIMLTPSAALAGSSVYTATITGGASGVKDLAGNALAGNYSWSFTTAAVSQPVTVQSFNTKTGTAATVHPLTGVPAGALLVLATTSDAVLSNCSVSSSPSLTWTKRADAGANNSDNAEIWTAVFSAGGTISVTSNWGAYSQASVCYVVLNAEPTLGGAFGTAVSQSAPSVTITTTRANSIIFGCTADWNRVDGTTRSLRDAATERLYFRDGNFTTYHYTKAATAIAAYTEGVSLPTGQSASTSLLEIRGNAVAADSPPSVTTQPASQAKCAGATASFTSAASGTPAPTVQWQVSTNGTTWTNITGATNGTLSFTTALSDNNKQYRAVWTNTAGTANSNAATLTVNAIPTLSSSLTATATSGLVFNYTPTSSTSGTTFAWSRAVVTGISNSAANGTGNISETLTNTTTSPVNVTYVYTLTANGCVNTQNVVVTVTNSIVAPTVTTQPASQTKCAGTSVSFTSAASGAPSPTVQWQQSTNGTTWTNITGATNATLSFTTALSDNNKQYRAVWTNTAGTVNSNAATLTVNAIPTLSSSLTATATSGVVFNYTPTSSTSGTTFAWSRAVVTGISNSAASGTGNISETLTNTTTSPVNVTYVYTLTANGCVNTQNVVVTVTNSIVAPTVTTQPASQTNCAGTSASFTSAAGGAPSPTVQWQQSTNGTTWTNITGATNATLSFTTATSDNNKQYRAVWTNSGGSVNSNAAILTVNATPTLSSSLTATATSGIVFTYTPTSSTSGTTFAWSRAVVTGISNAAANGTGNISETLTNTTTSPVNVTYVYTLTANGCINTQNVVVAVTNDIESPTVTTQPISQTRCAGVSASFSSAASGSPVPTVQWQESTNGTTWTNVTGATNATLSFTTALSDNNKQYRAVWTNTAGTVNSNAATLTVNATPTLSSSLTATATSGIVFNYIPTSSTSGTTFAWSRAVVTGISNSAASGTGNISETLTNTTTSPVNVTYVYTLTANGCVNTQNVVVTVTNSIVAPTVTTQPASQTKCAGTSVSFTSAAGGAPSPTVQWQQSTNGTTWTNITGATNATLSFTTATSDNNKQYRAVWTNSGGSVNSNAAILTVNATPTLSSSLTATATSGIVFTYTPTSSTSGTTFAWSRAVVTGISNSAANGTGNISETLTNTTTSPVNVTYVYTLTANGCVNTQNVVVTVTNDIEAPTVTTQPASQTKCAGTSASFTSAASGAPSPTVQWQESTNGTTWTNITGATNATLSFTTATSDNNKQYRAVWTNSGGSANSNAAILTVNATPTLSSSLTATATSGIVFNYTPTSSTSGATFAWSRALVTGISNAATNGTGNISETLTNTTTSPVDVTYVYTLTANGCVNTQNVIVTVNPEVIESPTVTTQPISQTKCSGENVSFTSAASGTPSPTVQWQESTDGIAWTNITGATNSPLSFTTSESDNNKQYRAVWTNSGGSANSTAAILTVNSIPSAPLVSVTNDCGNSILTASGYTGSLLWSNNETTESISVTNIATYTVIQTVNNCPSPAGSGSSAPKPIPALSSSSTATATSDVVFNYTPTSGTSGTTFAWSRAAVTGISNTAANGTGNIGETLTNTTTSPVTVTYVYTLTADGCINTQNVLVTVYPGEVIESPTVTTQPISQTRCAGVSASFSSAASGSPVPTVQWQESTNGTTWTNVTGATNATLSFTTALSDNNKQYRAVWTNTAGTVNSNAATLTVNATPTLSSSLTATATSGIVFNYIPTSSTSGTTFAWSRAVVTGISNSAASGTGNISETLTNTTTSPVNVTYVYTLTANGCVNTQNVVVTVTNSIVAPTVTTQPASQTKCAGTSVSFTSAASGAPSPTVQWQQSTNGTTWTNITGATNATLSFTTATSDNNKQYRAVWTNSGGSVNSNAAILTVNATPTLSSSLTATATSGVVFNYTPTSSTSGTTFAWSRAVVTGISNAAANGTGNISETLTNTTASPVNVTYVYTLTANGCPPNTQNLVVTVNPASATNCVINGSITSTFNSTSIPAGRYIWFSSVFDRGSFSGISGTVTFNVTNSVITFTANSQQYTLNVPNSRIRFDAAVTSATTQFINNVWETAIPRNYNGYVFMGGLAYQVPVTLPGNISNVRWTATINIDKPGVSLTWKWAAAVYISFAAHSGLNIKPKNGSTQNPYPNNDNAGTPENFKPSVRSGAKGSGGTNYTGSYSSTSNATCTVTTGQRPAEQQLITRQTFPKQVPELTVERLVNETFEVSAVPNPSSSIFNLIIKGTNKNTVRVRVTDIFGRVIEQYEKISANTIVQIGHRLKGGSYFVEVIQGDQRRFVKIIKVN